MVPLHRYAREAASNTIGPDGCPPAACVDATSVKRMPSLCADVFYCGSLAEPLWWKCGWGHGNLTKMLQQHVGRANAKAAWNEVVLDASGVVLPDSIAAFFYTAQASSEQRASLRDDHHAFLNAFHRHSGETPLLRYDPSATRDPFVEVNS